MAKLYNQNGSTQASDGCLLQPPEFECEDCNCTPCADPCADKCPPRVRVHKAIALKLNEYERCFSLFQRAGNESTHIPAVVTRVLLKVRRQGFCKVLTEECPLRANAAGDVCFLWSDAFRRLPEGYYEIDFYINDKLRFTLLLWKNEPWVVHTTTSDADQLPCSAPTGCLGCVPAADIDNNQQLGGCDATKCK